VTGDLRRAGFHSTNGTELTDCKRDPASSVPLSRSRRFDQSGPFVPEPEVFAIASFVVTAILLLILAASIRIVHEGEFIAVFRLGRARGVIGAGLAVVIPLIDRGVRVAVPVGMVDLGVARGQSRAERASPSQEIRGYPGLSMAEVCLRAAMLAREGSPKTRRATAEQFEEVLRELVRKQGPRSS
jgi:hypothetical protein